MAGFDDEIFGAPPAKPPVHAIGQPIDDLSAPELAERIEALKARDRAARARHRSAQRDARRRGRFLQILKRRPSRAGTPRRRWDTNGLLTIIIYE